MKHTHFLNNNYLRACAKCPEIQALSPHDCGVGLKDSLRPVGVIKGCDGFSVFYSGDGEIFGQKKGEPNYFWIPRIEDIIILSKQKAFARFGQMNDLKLDVFMRVVVSKLYCYSGCAALTFNEMWLVFFMAEIHKKQWNSQREEWEAVG